MAGAPNRGFAIDDNPAHSGAAGAERRLPGDHTGLLPGAGHHAGPRPGFDDRDAEDRPPVVIVNQTFADRFLPGVDPLKHTITFGGERRHEIVGVVADARYRDIERPADPTFYVPLDQNDERWPFLSFTAWTDGDAAALGPVFREAMREADPNQPLSRVRTYDELLATAHGRRAGSTRWWSACSR